MNQRHHAEQIPPQALARYCGNPYQLFGTRHYRLSDGEQDGCRCIDVRTGSGFDYTVVCDRGLDLSLASYRGVNLVHLTANTEKHPSFYDPHGTEWMRTFSAGLLTTCGPTNLGPPCEDQGEKLGQHGRFSALAGRQVCDLTDEDTGAIEITGLLYDSSTFGHKLRIRRTIRSQYGVPAVRIRDEILNQGGGPVPLTMLYHINFGFPFLTENTRIHIPSACCEGYDEFSQQRLDQRFSPLSPSPDNLERNYMHTFRPEEPVTALVWNRDLLGGLAAYIRFDPEQLPTMTQWMLENPRDFVAAIEPANVPCESRDILRQRGQLPMLEPGETKVFEIEIGVVEGNDAIAPVFEKQV